MLAKETNKLTISIYLTQYGIKTIQYPQGLESKPQYP